MNEGTWFYPWLLLSCMEIPLLFSEVYYMKRYLKLWWPEKLIFYTTRPYPRRPGSFKFTVSYQEFSLLSSTTQSSADLNWCEYSIWWSGCYICISSIWEPTRKKSSCLNQPKFWNSWIVINILMFELHDIHFFNTQWFRQCSCMEALICVPLQQNCVEWEIFNPMQWSAFTELKIIIRC